MTAEWKTKTPEEILDDVRGIMRYSREQNITPTREVYSESTLKHLLGLGYFPGIKLSPEYQAKEINARLAPKWPRILRGIRNTIAFNDYMEHHDSQHPDPVSKYAGIPGLDAHAVEVAYHLLLQSGRGTYKTPLALRGRK